MEKLRRPKILIVEDETSLLTVLADKFKREGFLVVTANDGQEGIEAATAQRPQLIILDLIMPGMDGLTMLKKLREDKWGQHAPVLILSNLSDTEAIEQANGRGVLDFLVKSNWGLDDVVSKAREVLKKA